MQRPAAETVRRRTRCAPSSPAFPATSAAEAQIPAARLKPRGRSPATSRASGTLGKPVRSLQSSGPKEITMNRHLLNRRQFSARCAAFGLALPLSATRAARASAQVSATAAGSKPAARPVKLPDGASVAPLGQGCWHLGRGRHPLAVEEEALRTGISLGMTLIDTSGNYGHGRSEKFISHVIAGQRERIFLVSKVEGNQVS